MEPYAAAFSEAALIKERFAVEVAWLKYLASLPEVAELGTLSAAEQAALQGWASRLGLAEAAEVKRVEARTNHDVKAVEYYLKRRLVEELGWSEERAEFVHFAAHGPEQLRQPVVRLHLGGERRPLEAQGRHEVVGDLRPIDLGVGHGVSR